MAENVMDIELAAIAAVWKALEPLDPEARQRVTSYVFARMGISRSPITGIVQSSPRLAVIEPNLQQNIDGGSKVNDIRSFAEMKMPRSANERAALVAFFLRYEALADERKDTINKNDIKKYFLLAKFPPTANPKYTLGNSMKAGYLDLKGKGEYALNAVGYNLIAHKLPSKEGRTPQKSSRHRSRTSRRR